MPTNRFGVTDQDIQRIFGALEAQGIVPAGQAATHLAQFRANPDGYEPEGLNNLARTAGVAPPSAAAPTRALFGGQSIQPVFDNPNLFGTDPIGSFDLPRGRATEGRPFGEPAPARPQEAPKRQLAALSEQELLEAMTAGYLTRSEVENELTRYRGYSPEQMIGLLSGGLDVPTGSRPAIPEARPTGEFTSGIGSALELTARPPGGALTSGLGPTSGVGSALELTAGLPGSLGGRRPGAQFGDFAPSESIIGALGSSGRPGSLDPDAQSLANRRETLAESEEGRRTLFGTAVRGQYPTVNPWQDYLLSRYDPTYAQYQVERGLSPTPPSDFSQYATQGSATNMNPDVWKAYLQTATGLLASPDNDMPERQGAFRDWLRNADNQYALALESTLARTPGALRPAVRAGAGRVFQDMFVNQPTQQFLPWFTGRGQRFF